MWLNILTGFASLCNELHQIEINYFTGACDSYLYFKSDGSLKCGSKLDYGLTFSQASDQCAEIGEIIPELPSPNDQQIINIIRVIIYLYLKFHS